MKNQTNIRDKSMDYKYGIKQLATVGEGQICTIFTSTEHFFAIAFEISNFEGRKEDEILYTYLQSNDRSNHRLDIRNNFVG